MSRPEPIDPVEAGREYERQQAQRDEREADLLGKIQAQAEQIDRLEQQLSVTNQIGDTFWEALKLLNLQAIDVNNPGRHFTAAITSLQSYNTKQAEKIAGMEREILRLRQVLKKAHDAMFSWYSSEYAAHPLSQEVSKELYE